MKKNRLAVVTVILLFLVLVAMVTFAYLTRPSPEEIAKLNQEQVKRQQQFTVSQVKAALLYFKDDRTGLCFAYYWGGMANGGPALAVVPEEKVEHLLVK